MIRGLSQLARIKSQCVRETVENRIFFRLPENKTREQQGNRYHESASEDHRRNIIPFSNRDAVAYDLVKERAESGNQAERAWNR